MTSFVFAQEINLGGNATLWVGGQASFYFGGNTTLNGVVTNNGEIISFSDLDFVGNTVVGNLRFIGDGDQNLSGGELDVTDMVVDKAGNSNVVLLTDQVVVSGMLDVTNGVIQAEDELDLLVRGNSENTGQGFVEGKLVGQSTGQPITFPMGINDAPNYLTISGTNAETVIRVECVPLDPTTLRADEDIISIAEEVEWIITSIGDGTTGQLTINFSGVNLETENIESIRAELFEPAIVALVDGDSLFRVLTTLSIADLDNQSPTPPRVGTIVVDDNITISDRPVHLAVAWIPVVDDVEIYVPNAFAPGGSQLDNRIFRPFFSGDELNGISISVINSLNQEVYSVSQSGTNLDLSLFGWNGVLPSGQDAPSGVYYYNIVLTPATTERITRIGSFLLVK